MATSAPFSTRFELLTSPSRVVFRGSKHFDQCAHHAAIVGNAAGEANVAERRGRHDVGNAVSNRRRGAAHDVLAARELAASQLQQGPSK